MLNFLRADFSGLHAWEARQAFVRNIMNGEASIDLADAAFHIAAEDDALVSHSTVKLPVQLYSKRLQRMAEEIARHKLNHMPLVGSDRDPHAVMQVGDNSSGFTPSRIQHGPILTPERSEAVPYMCFYLILDLKQNKNKPSGSFPSCFVILPTSPPGTAASTPLLQVVQKYLYSQQNFQTPFGATSGMPVDSIVDHPGVWENARHAYLHEVLISKKGIAAALAIVQADILQRLMKLGSLDSVIRTDCSDFTR